MKKKSVLPRRRGKNYYTSVSKSLKEQGKIDNHFEIQISQLTIEDLLALKLELSAKSFGGKLYGYPLYQNMNNILREALIKFTLSVTPSKAEASDMLGCTIEDLNGFIKKYHLQDFAQSIISPRSGRIKT